MLIFQPENLPVVQHSPSVHSYSAHTWLEASAMRTFPDDSQAVNVSHRGAEKTKRQKMPDSVHKNKDTKERNRQQDECRLKSPAQQIKKAAAKREKLYTNTGDRRLYPPYNIVPPNIGCRRIAFGLHWRCASCLLDKTSFRTSQLEWENNGTKQTPFQTANKKQKPPRISNGIKCHGQKTSHGRPVLKQIGNTLTCTKHGTQSSWFWKKKNRSVLCEIQRFHP